MTPSRESGEQLRPRRGDVHPLRLNFAMRQDSLGDVSTPRELQLRDDPNSSVLSGALSNLGIDDRIEGIRARRCDGRRACEEKDDEKEQRSALRTEQCHYRVITLRRTFTRSSPPSCVERFRRPYVSERFN